MGKKSLVRNAVFNIIYKVLNVAFPLAISMYIARVLKADGVGQVAYAKNIVSYFSMAAALGIPQYGIKEIARRNDKLYRDRTFSELFLINSFSTSIAVGLYLVFVLGLNDLKMDLQLYLAVGISLFFNYFNVDWLYQGLELYDYIAIRSLIVKILSFAAIISIVKTKDQVVTYALISSLAVVGNYLFNIVHLRKYVKFSFKSINIRRHIKPVLYLLVFLASMELYSKIDITMLGHYFEKDIVGYYNNAQKTINVVLTLIIAITGVFIPRLSSYYDNDKTKFDYLLNEGLHIVLFLSIPCTLGLLLLGKQAITILYGDSFASSVPAMRILSFLIIIKSLGDILCYQVLICSNNEKELLAPNILSAIINVGFNFILIPSMMHIGAAIASVAGELVLNILLFLKSSKIVRIKVNVKDLRSILFGIIGMSLFILIFNHISLINEFIRMCICIFFGGAIYLVITYYENNTVCQKIFRMLFRNIGVKH